MGPHCADVFDPRRWAPDTGVVTLEVMRVVLAVGLFAIGVELPGPYMMKHVRGLIVLVVPTMAIGWIVVAGMYAPPSFRTVFLHIFPQGLCCCSFRLSTSYPVWLSPPASLQPIRLSPPPSSVSPPGF